ncbi:MAG: hypothetical protein L6277_03830 [Desulfobacterales bacterium]|nr:hypothetical protein [Pseudomonadota bacterium]MBU4356097.1 hypothetical protein [Pseudomonadota bacterium]MCG2771204.1 hypothetical protein [Desulfobacterales bacterium]
MLFYPGPLGCINYQRDGEIAAYAFYRPNGAEVRGTAHLDFDCHKVVMGLAYHW